MKDNSIFITLSHNILKMIYDSVANSCLVMIYNSFLCFQLYLVAWLILLCPHHASFFVSPFFATDNNKGEKIIEQIKFSLFLFPVFSLGNQETQLVVAK